MKYVLILCDNPIAKHFLAWTHKRRVGDNYYIVASLNENILPPNSSKSFQLKAIDPTSFSKLRNISSEYLFSAVFIIMGSIEDTNYVLQNVRKIDQKVIVTLLDYWGLEYAQYQDKNLHIINANTIIASHLYHNLPNVPLIAQNIGLGEGEIMEVLVPYGSSFAYRHVGSIAQRKWKIVALYREQKQLLPSSATMIRPSDTLIIMGRPLVLDGVYRTINRRKGLFPEPFGKNIYLLLDFRYDQYRAIDYLSQAIYLQESLRNKKLKIRIINATNFGVMNDIKRHRSDTIEISISYGKKDFKEIVEYDIQNFDVGVVLTSVETMVKNSLEQRFYELKKPIYLFGDYSIFNIKTATILASGDNYQMESISSTAFDLCETLKFALLFSHCDPDGDFKSKKMIIEHYETLAQIFNYPIEIEQKIANPIRELNSKNDTLHILPFNKALRKRGFMRILSQKMEDYVLSTSKHPKLLIPAEAL
ncbi:MAG: hypothetical protein KU38_01750 [Sulfurovum sp. FS08-3]|nr:MAG: hypothetical protein KU38_01750 [Sulfurovum sp. FS08-3]